MGSAASKMQEAIKESLSYFNDVVKAFKTILGVNLSENENIKEGLDSLIQNNNEMNSQEKEALKQIAGCHDKTMAAQNAANVCVRRIQSLAKSTSRTLNYANDFEQTKKALELYAKRGTEESTKVEEAMKAMTTAGSACNNAGSYVKVLVDWCDRKKKELEAKLGNMKASERGKAYGGASGATVGTAAVCACIPVIGWIAGPFITAAVAAVSFGTAAGIAEGCTIPQMIEIMDTAKAGLTTVRAEFEQMAKSLMDHSADIEKKKVLLRNILGTLLETINGAEDVSYFGKIAIPELKRQFLELENLCVSYFE
eukprot:GFUD01008363.1.p1 GENE.GFUD01008363.1~~GFUD01008363.1.p1  ORF type:complete len:326 (-),score=81.06 GFUD01008363.1:3-935(-)